MKFGEDADKESEQSHYLLEILRFSSTTIFSLLKNLNNDLKRYNCLISCFEQANSYAVMALVLRYLMDGKDGKNLLAKEKTDDLNKIWQKKITALSKDDPQKLLQNYHLSVLMSHWYRYGDVDSAKSWFRENILNDRIAIFQYLSGTLIKTYTYYSPERGNFVGISLDWENILKFASINELYSAITMYPYDELDEKEKWLFVEITSFASDKILQITPPDFFNDAVTKESVKSYCRWINSDLPTSDKLERLLLKDIDLRKYPKIVNLELARNDAKEFLEWYIQKNPDVFKHSIDYITKALGFADEDFRKRHFFSKQTLEAFEEFFSQNGKSQ